MPVMFLLNTVHADPAQHHLDKHSLHFPAGPRPSRRRHPPTGPLPPITVPICTYISLKHCHRIPYLDTPRCITAVPVRMHALPLEGCCSECSMIQGPLPNHFHRANWIRSRVSGLGCVLHMSILSPTYQAITRMFQVQPPLSFPRRRTLDFLCLGDGILPLHHPRNIKPAQRRIITRKL